MASNNGDYKTGRVYAFQRWRRGILIALLPVFFEKQRQQNSCGARASATFDRDARGF
jgi:hypothetical protein